MKNEIEDMKKKKLDHPEKKKYSTWKENFTSWD